MEIARGVHFGTVSRSIVVSSSLSKNARLLYVILATYADRNTRSWRVSRARLASDLDASEATVKRALRELEGAGVIVRQRHRAGGREGVATTVLHDFVAVYND
jgi:DNA-binding MarR family transcriptional regulator